MTILVTTKSWRKPTVARARLGPDRLSPEEAANVRKALFYLRARQGGSLQLAEALGVSLSAVGRALLAKGQPSAGLALRAAKLAKQPIDALLSGAFPSEGACPHCGRTA
jgi:hypothetical protein